MKCFVIMPFANSFDDVYATITSAVKSSVPGETLVCTRLDDLKYAGRISEALLEEIRESTICIADVTGNNPNVMWEIGYAMALQKPLIVITQEIGALPFDLADWRAIPYNRQSLKKSLDLQLVQAVRDTLGKYEIRRERSKLRTPVARAPKSIAITGSQIADRTKCMRRIESVLEPYLEEDLTWYCGTMGTSDECAIDFLGHHHQKIVLVGYHEFDLSEAIFEKIEQYNLPFIDAQKEQLPKGIAGATSPRNTFFLLRADLFTALWNGASGGTRRLIEWFAKNKKDHLVGFV